MPERHDPRNRYDRMDVVQQVAMLGADGPDGRLKLAAYRVRDPETQEWSTLQFHATYGKHRNGRHERELCEAVRNICQ